MTDQKINEELRLIDENISKQQIHLNTLYEQLIESSILCIQNGFSNEVKRRISSNPKIIISLDENNRLKELKNKCAEMEESLSDEIKSRFKSPDLWPHSKILEIGLSNGEDSIDAIIDKIFVSIMKSQNDLLKQYSLYSSQGASSDYPSTTEINQFRQSMEVYIIDRFEKALRRYKKGFSDFLMSCKERTSQIEKMTSDKAQALWDQ